jgi:Secretion system C-terminal sorting domain
MMDNGSMSFQTNVRMRFRVHPDSLRSRGVTMNQMSLLFLDTDNQWKICPNQKIDVSTNTISIAQASTYSYFALSAAKVNTVSGLGSEIPQNFYLNQNFPNPFNPATTISYQLPKSGHVKLAVYDLLGHEIATLVNGDKPEGYYSVSFDASQIPSGMYLCRLGAGEYTKTTKMILTK